MDEKDNICMSWIIRYRWRALTMFILVLSLLTALALSSVRHTLAAPSLVQLSSDPYTNSRNEHQTEVSPASSSYGSMIVSAFQVGHGSKNGGSSNIGWATSSDSGMTWTNGFLPHTTKLVKGIYDRVENPSVAYDAAHNTWMITTSAFISNNSIAILVNLSTNGGTSWSEPYTV